MLVRGVVDPSFCRHRQPVMIQLRSRWKNDSDISIVIEKWEESKLYDSLPSTIV